MNFARARIEAHNQWPKITQFQGEEKFARQLSLNGGVAPFQPIPISTNDDHEYQRCVGHFLDALDQIPNRPDYAFDHFYRVIDKGGSALFPDQGNKGIAQGLGKKFLAHNRLLWESVIDSLCISMPLRTLEFLAKRVLAAEPLAPEPNKALHNRAQNAFGQRFHSAFIRKYTCNELGFPIADAANASRTDAAKLLKLYMSGKAGTRTKTGVDPALDLTAPTNVPDHARRFEVMLSLLLFTIRNERAHGITISPFRTSKSSIDRYESYYYTMLLAYVVSLGVLEFRFSCVTPSDLLDGCITNIQIQKSFFSAV